MEEEPRSDALASFLSFVNHTDKLPRSSSLARFLWVLLTYEKRMATENAAGFAFSLFPKLNGKVSSLWPGSSEFTKLAD